GKGVSTRHERQWAGDDHRVRNEGLRAAQRAESNWGRDAARRRLCRYPLDKLGFWRDRRVPRASRRRNAAAGMVVDWAVPMQRPADLSRRGGLVCLCGSFAQFALVAAPYFTLHRMRQGDDPGHELT